MTGKGSGVGLPGAAWAGATSAIVAATAAAAAAAVITGVANRTRRDRLEVRSKAVRGRATLSEITSRS